MKRKYQNPRCQALYDVCFDRGADDFMRRRGGAIQCAFMDGYKEIKKPSSFTRGTTVFYAFMAGKDRKKAEDAGKIAPTEVKDKRLLE